MNNKIIIPKITKEEFWEKLKNRKYEDTELIKNIENFFRKKRGYIFKMPKPGDKVILLVSGGLDSIIAWAILMDIYKLQVYPLSTQIRKTHPQYESLQYFARFFKKKYPAYFKSPFLLSQGISPPELKSIYHSKYIHPERILNFYQLGNNLNPVPLNGLSSILSIHSFLYRQYLSLKENINIDTIFCAIEAGDGTVIKSQTFTYLRTSMLYLSLFNRDFSFQYASLFLEKEICTFLEKYQSFQLGNQLGLPLHKTYSCYKGEKLHCGTCLSCYSRRLGLKKAGITDQTIYQDQLWKYKLINKFKYHLVNRTPFTTLVIKFIRKIFILIKERDLTHNLWI